MSASTKRGRDSRLYVGPCLDPSDWPDELVRGLHGLQAYADLDQPTPNDLFARDQLICNLQLDGEDFWNRHCKVNASTTQGTETTDNSDDCNTDSTLVSKNTTSMTFTYKKRKTTQGIEGITARRIKGSYDSEGCLVLPVMWLDCERNREGADGIWMLALVTDFSLTGNLTDPLEFSATVQPGDVPIIEDGQQGEGRPMVNKANITCFQNIVLSDLPADFYKGEIARFGGQAA